ncbi:MAG: hypothetical protein ACR2FU_01175 [Streptosporangiaceae bacterium]
MRRPVDHLSGSEAPDVGPPAEAESRAGLVRRLRGLPVNHVSAVSDTPRPASAGADGERAPLAGALRAGDNPTEPAEARVPKPPLWHHVSYFKTLWTDHQRRWPDPGGPEPDGADRRRRDDPPGSWRGSGDQYLSPDANSEADSVIAALQQCEPAVSELLQVIEQENKHGGVLVGLEHSRKGADRIKEKLAEKIDLGLGDGPADVASAVRDAVRYTFCLDPDNYGAGHDDIVALLEAKGCSRDYSRNHWLDGGPYEGVNSQWMSPGGGRFELQFHTRESFYAKETLTHPAYERLRSPATSWEERLELDAFQELVSGAVSEPHGIDQIADQERRA